MLSEECFCRLARLFSQIDFCVVGRLCVKQLLEPDQIFGLDGLRVGKPLHVPEQRSKRWVNKTGKGPGWIGGPPVLPPASNELMTELSWMEKARCQRR